MKQNRFEIYGRAPLRMVLAFVFSLHGFRHAFGAFAASGGRRGIPMALDGLPAVFGALEIAGGLLLFFGLATRPTALILAAEALAAYCYAAAPRGVWPIRNGGNEALLYFLAFLYFAAFGAGAWSLDEVVARYKGRAGVRAPESL
jgi:putative oxidoreductase